MKKVLLLIACTFTLGFCMQSPAQSPQKFAVIITGDSPGDGYQGQFAIPNSDYDEFWNDTYLMWEMLVTKFGFNNDKVFVLYATGDDYASQNPRYTVSNSGIPGLTKITDFSASKSHVEEVLGGLATQLTNDDFLFVFTFGHGGMDATLTHGALQLNDTIMLDTEFGDLVNTIPANKRVIWMQNCAGGDFEITISDELKNLLTSTN